MLRRDQQLRTQIQQLLDAGLFALALWLAHLCRESWVPEFLWWNFDPIEPFARFKGLYLMIIPSAPLILETQEFYKRPLFCPRRRTA